MRNNTLMNKRAPEAALAQGAPQPPRLTATEAATGGFVFTPAHRNAGQPVRRLSSSQLFGDSREIEIEHGGSCYRLRQTALGKLIMTK